MRPLSLATGQLRALKRFSPASSSLSSTRDLSSLSSLEKEEGGAVPTFRVYNPAHPSHVVGSVPLMTLSDTVDAIAFSSSVLDQWRDRTTAAHRASLLSRWSGLLKDNAEVLASLITLESGKPLAEARGEVQYGASFLDYYAAEAVRPSSAGGGFVTPTPFAGAGGNEPRGQTMAVHQAVGVAAMVTPWNFPLAMITRKVGPALSVGCTAIVKPSELTPLTAVAIQNLAAEAGFPEGVLQLITTDKDNTRDVVMEMCSSPDVHKVSFTGSTAVGKLLMKHSSSTVKRLSLELGGNAPFVVFEDANLEQAVEAALSAKFRNAGQTCVSANRFLVHSSVHDAFVELFSERIQQKLVPGDGMSGETTLGPLISANAATVVHRKIVEAVKEGAECVVGGYKIPSLGPNFVEPTVLTNVSTDSRIWKTESFGPVAALRSFEDEQEALAIANDSRAGLASYFCTQDLSRVFRFSQRLQSGIVGVNDGIISTCTSPFGGVKESGMGREGSSLGVAEYLQTKYVFLNC